MQPLAATKVKETSQMNARLGQGREGLRHKLKTLMPPPANKPIVQSMEKSIEQLKVPIPKTSRIHYELVPISDYTAPHTRSGDDLCSRMVNRKTIQDVNRKIPIYPDPTDRPFLNQ